MHFENKILFIFDIAKSKLNYSQSLHQHSLEQQDYWKAIEAACKTLEITELSEDVKIKILKKLQTEFVTSMESGLFFADKSTHKPWLQEQEDNIDWYYWKRYKKYLESRLFPSKVISTLSEQTDKIIDHLQNPSDTGSWKRKGLVVGHVQSGKTANYIGLINKAADAGYKIIIVLAGMLNELRRQTQERIDEGFLGYESYGDSKNSIGVGLVDAKHRPVCLTDTQNDFGSADKGSNIHLSALNKPLVLVIKKNVKTLENLIKWLSSGNQELTTPSLLLIDDEADHASINTLAKPDESTAINKRIRQVLKLFSKASYVGYTATPFANIFIDPDKDEEMAGEDLFPSDFILALSAPTNYIGPNRIFSEDADLNIIRPVDDFQISFPIPHNKDLDPKILPASLCEAIQAFILIRAIRILRGQTNAHNSMLVNVSRFTNVQTHVRMLIQDYVFKLHNSIMNNYALKPEDACRDSQISELYSLWEKEFQNLEFGWDQIQKQLGFSISPIKVIEVNSSPDAEPVDYSTQEYPSGRNVIAVGGLSLSRGLTLEGLTVSYFLRNSIMYDTLMQMGRWFGYREGYEDICRLYMTDEAISWYSYITNVMDELRSLFAQMNDAGLAPKDFGLAVRNHPGALIVTAKNKMRSATTIVKRVDLEGALVETSYLFLQSTHIETNFKTTERLLSKINKQCVVKKDKQGYIWKNVPMELVQEFLEDFLNYPSSLFTDKTPLIEYLDKLHCVGQTTVDVAFFSPKPSPLRILRRFGNLPIYSQERKISITSNNLAIVLNKRRVASRGSEAIGLSDEMKTKIKTEFAGQKNIPDYTYRAKRLRPLLMLHLLDVRSKDDSNPLLPEGVIAWGLSFPGSKERRGTRNLVTYTVNMTGMKDYFPEALGGEEEDLDE